MRLMKKNLTLTLIALCFFYGHISYAGYMSLQDNIYRPSDDLTCSAETLKICRTLKQQIRTFKYTSRIKIEDFEQIKKTNKGLKIDYSLFNPEESDIWQEQEPLNISNKNLLDNKQKVSFESYSPMGGGNFRTLIKTQDAQQFRLILGRQSHNILLRKALLRKLGYLLPDSNHVQKISIKFKNSFQLRDFLEKMERSLATRNLGRWVTNIKKEEKKEDGNSKSSKWVVTDTSQGKHTLILQDALVTQSHDKSYDLSIGLVPSLVKNRRVFKALLIPYALVNVPESFNKWNWNMGKTVDEHIFLKTENEDFLRIGYDDGKWIARRILKLKRKDFKDIVREAALPESVSLLAVEKMISRRNSLCKVFKEDQSCFQAVNIKITDPQNPHLLSEGRLLLDTKQGDPKDKNHWWIGYGSRFSFGPNESPLSRKEMGAYLRSQVVSNIISYFLGRFNGDVSLNSADRLKKKASEAYVKDYFNDLVESVARKEPLPSRPGSFKVWGKTFADIKLQASRDVIFGNYLGTDNKIQMAHSFGWSLDLGLFLGSHGGNENLIFSARPLGVSYSEIYTQLTPFSSMEVANKTPFKNIFVNYMMKRVSRNLDKVRKIEQSASSNPEKEDSQDKEKLIEELSDTLNENLAVGESFIIRRLIGPFSSISLSINAAKHGSIDFSSRNQVNVIERIHIFRKDKDTIHIYASQGNNTEWTFSFRLRKFIPIFTYVYQKRQTVENKPVETKFLALDIKKRNNPSFETNVTTLQNFFKNPFRNENVFEAISENNHSEFQIEFEEQLNDFTFLWARSTTLSQASLINVKETLDQKTFSKKFIWASSGSRKGADYQTVLLNILDHAIKNTFKIKKVDIRIANTGRPSETIFGSSSVQQSFFEGVFDEEAQEIKEPFIHAVYNFKGWGSSQKHLKKLVKKVNSFQESLEEKTNLPPIEFETFSLTEKLQLYSLFYNIYIYEKGIYNVLNWGYSSNLKDRKQKIYNLFETHGGFENVFCSAGEAQSAGGTCLESARNRLVRTFIRAQDTYKESIFRKKPKEQAQNALNMIQVLMALNFHGLVEASGGIENIYTTSGALGYRKGDEGNHTPIRGGTLGRAPEHKPYGPINYTVRRLKTTPSEFYFYWLLRRL